MAVAAERDYVEARSGMNQVGVVTDDEAVRSIDLLPVSVDGRRRPLRRHQVGGGDAPHSVSPASTV